MANIKNEIHSKEKSKKKNYTKSETFMIMLAIILIGTGTGLGIYYGINKNHNGNTIPPNTTIPITPINLNTLNQTAIPGKENMIQDDAFNVFINNNKEKYPDLKSNVEISSFIASSHTLTGKLIVKAKTNSTKYTGSISVTINIIGKINLTDLIKTTKIHSVNNNVQIITAFLAVNSTSGLIESDLEVTSYTLATTTNTGSAIINAKTDNSDYTGQVNVTIEMLGIREQILQTLRNAYLNNDDDGWIPAWRNYFELLSETVNSITYVLTNEQLKDNSQIQETIFNQFRTSILAELKNWNIPKGYQENTIKINYSSFNITNETITTTGEIALKIYYLNVEGMNFNWFKDFRFEIKYVIAD